MHWRGPSTVMESRAEYGDVVADVRDELARRVEALVGAGVDARQLILDPGLGFGKRAHHSWRLLAHLDALLALGRPVLIGSSRKRFLAEVVTDRDGAVEGPASPRERDGATAATSALAAAAGVWGVRVHEVADSADAVRAAARWVGAR
jgi:dihydropteroate synthase